MINIIKHIITALSGIRLAPLVVLMLLSRNRELLWADMDQLAQAWTWQLGGSLRAPQAENLSQRIPQFVSFMTWIREFRNVFYFRTGKPGMLLSFLCRPMSSLEMYSKMKVGPGLFIMHGNGTLISAEGIGENCRIYHQVTIGAVEAVEGGRPTIGNNVTIYAGAKVVGKVRIGDNVTIAANSLVIKNVPSDVTVMGVPAVVIWRKKGSRTENEPSIGKAANPIDDATEV
jgi:serine O-acetyltransferase